MKLIQVLYKVPKYVHKNIHSFRLFYCTEKYVPFWKLKIGILFTIQSFFFIGNDVQRDTCFLRLRLEFVLYWSMADRMLFCGTTSHIFVIVFCCNSGIETPVSSFCTMTTSVCSKHVNLSDLICGIWCPLCGFDEINCRVV
jgi:hypothetical protein